MFETREERGGALKDGFPIKLLEEMYLMSNFISIVDIPFLNIQYLIEVIKNDNKN